MNSIGQGSSPASTQVGVASPWRGGWRKLSGRSPSAAAIMESVMRFAAHPLSAFTHSLYVETELCVAGFNFACNNKKSMTAEAPSNSLNSVGICYAHSFKESEHGHRTDFRVRQDIQRRIRRRLEVCVQDGCLFFSLCLRPAISHALLPSHRHLTR